MRTDARRAVCNTDFQMRVASLIFLGVPNAAHPLLGYLTHCAGPMLYLTLPF